MTDSAQIPDLVFCAECSRLVGEQVFGTAPRVDVWIMLEYTGPWNAKALPQSDLPAEIKAHIDGWTSRMPNNKFQFVKQQDSKATPDCTLFVALTREQDPRLFEFRLERYADLLALDVPRVAAEPDAYEAHRRKTPLFTVCTNGRRDVSCSKYGIPVYAEAQRVAGEMVWQSTHLGGHRFAANLVCFPYGVVYGHVDADDVEEIVAESVAGRVVTGRLRGRSCYDAPVQAADYYLRGVAGIDDLLGVQLASVESDGAQAWTVRFVTPPDGARHAVRLGSRTSEWTVYESTGDAERKPMPQFHFVGHEVEKG